MRRCLTLLSAIPALALFLWIFFPGECEPQPPQAEDSRGFPEVHAAEPALEIPLASEPASRRNEAKPEPAPVQPAKRDQSPLLAELHGRLLLEGGAPARGARVELSGWPGNGDRSEWKGVSADADAEGRFTLRFEPPRAFQFALGSSYPGCVSAKWRWLEIEAGAKLELGEVTLPLGGAITGRIVDARGNPLHESCIVYAEGAAVAFGTGGDASRGMGQSDATTGEFTIPDMPPGPVQLKAHSELADWIDGPSVEVHAGGTVEALIRYTGPDNSRRISLFAFSQPFYAFSHDVSGIRASAPGVQTRAAQRIANAPQGFCFDELQPGAYSVTIDDPRFKPWRQDGVAPGQSVRATLEGASGVRLSVQDRAGGAIEHYALRVRFEQVEFSPNEFEVFGASEAREPEALVEGLIPVEQTLIVLAEGYAPCEIALPDLQAGEIRPLVAELRRGATVLARVLQSDGKTPVAGLSVTLRPADPALGARAAEGAGAREATSAADGRASFTAVAAGTYSLRAEWTPQLAAELGEIEIGAEDSQHPFELVLPPCGWLVGRVLGFEGSPLEGCALAVLPADATPEERAEWATRAAAPERALENRIAADGTFRAGPLRIGRSRVELEYPSITVRYGQNSLSNLPGSAIVLGEVEVPAGGELRRDFDLEGRTPGWIAADVRVQGQPAPDARVFVQAADEGQRNGAIQLDVDGQGTSGPIAPGSVRIEIAAADGSWRWTAPGTWNVESGETLRVAFDIPLVYGSLQLVDDVSGIALAGRQVLVRRDGNGGYELFEVTADAQGRLHLQLVPAAYLVEFLIEIGRDGRRGLSPYEAARFDWNASRPGNSVLRLRRRR